MLSSVPASVCRPPVLRHRGVGGGVADAGGPPGLGCPPASLAAQGEGLLAVREGLVEVAELTEIPADAVEGIGLAHLVAGGGVQLEGLPGLVGSSGVLSLAAEHVREAQMHVSLPAAVAPLPEQPHGVPEMGVRVVMAGEPYGGAGEII